MDLKLNTPIRFIPMVGPKRSSLLEKLEIFTAFDLLFYPPHRYNDYSLISKIVSVQPGEIVTIAGTIDSMHNIITRNGKKIQKAIISDTSASIECIWFNQPFLKNIFVPNVKVQLSGKVNWFGRSLAMISPDYELISKTKGIHTGRLVPIYSETEGISSKWLRSRIKYIYDNLGSQIDETLPDNIISQHNLLFLKTAISYLHYPDSIKQAQSARYRLAFDEILAIQLASYLKKQKRIHKLKSYSIHFSKNNLKKFVSSLPFVLTEDQTKSINEILKDISKNIPANRLLEGDVGSGKTVVAAAAMYASYINGYTSLLMAPTQILAHQHFTTINSLFSKFKISPELITGNTKTITRRVANNPAIIIGTHALISYKIPYDNLALVIIDEQQRFGVEQRQKLLSKSKSNKIPHFVTMTATPIPRTIALTLFGHLDISIIKQMPKRNKKIKTWIVPKLKRSKSYQWIESQITDNNAQVFFVCPLIEQSESLESVKSASQEYKKLKQIFHNRKVKLLHGRLKSMEKNRIITDFKNKKIDILVSTPVVEVGIDIPNATIMVIEAAERFGLAQLHQLRGRVGRSDKQSFCLLFTEKEDDNTVLKRLKALKAHHTGPELAEIDLKLRGPGEIFGTKQHGLPKLKYADLLDNDLIKSTSSALSDIVKKDPSLDKISLLSQRFKLSTIATSNSD